MKCPRCETASLDERERDGVTVDVCRDCRGIWLDRSELERIVARAVREQEELETRAAAPQPSQPPPAQPPPPQAYEQRPYPYRRDDDTPPHGHRHGGYPKRKKHWFETLGDIFD